MTELAKIALGMQAENPRQKPSKPPSFL